MVLVTIKPCKMRNKIPRVAVREQDPLVRATNYEEVSYGYNQEEAVLEASRCLDCKNPRCVPACPVAIDIPKFIREIENGEFLLKHLKLLRETALCHLYAAGSARRSPSAKGHVYLELRVRQLLLESLRDL